MFAEFISLASWTNGVVMIGVFVAVVIILITVLFLLMHTAKKEKNS
jgi:Tfp pilus assembly protein PilV